MRNERYGHILYLISVLGYAESQSRMDIIPMQTITIIIALIWIINLLIAWPTFGNRDGLNALYMQHNTYIYIYVILPNNKVLVYIIVCVVATLCMRSILIKRRDAFRIVCVSTIFHLSPQGVVREERRTLYTVSYIDRWRYITFDWCGASLVLQIECLCAVWHRCKVMGIAILMRIWARRCLYGYMLRSMCWFWFNDDWVFICENANNNKIAIKYTLNQLL